MSPGIQYSSPPTWSHLEIGVVGKRWRKGKFITRWSDHRNYGFFLGSSLPFLQFFLLICHSKLCHRILGSPVGRTDIRPITVQWKHLRLAQNPMCDHGSAFSSSHLGCYKILKFKYTVLRRLSVSMETKAAVSKLLRDGHTKPDPVFLRSSFLAMAVRHEEIHAHTCRHMHTQRTAAEPHNGCLVLEGLGP